MIQTLPVSRSATSWSLGRRACLCLLFGALAVAEDASITVHPVVDEAMLINPGKGWVQYGRPNNRNTAEMIGVGYARFDWSVLQPAEDQFDWSTVDQALAAFKAYGKRTVIGVMNASVHMKSAYCTPKWVFDAGAATFTYQSPYWPEGKQVIAANWQDDQVFLRKMQAFVAAFGKRYDGHPDVEAVDVRSYGNWGEGHFGEIPGAKALKVATPDVLKTQYFQPYFTAFPKTRLVIPWGQASFNSVYDWASEQGAGMRRDGILSHWSPDGVECLRSFGHAPAHFEFCWNYRETKAQGWWKPDVLLKSIRTGKPTFIQFYDDMYNENKELFREIGNLVGYHFVLDQAVYPSAITSDQSLALTTHWRNDGVAPLYNEALVAVALLDAGDHVVSRAWLSGVDPRTWAPDAVTKVAARATLPAAKAGAYRLALGLFAHREDSSPVYRIGNQGRTEDGWYVLGPITIR